MDAHAEMINGRSLEISHPHKVYFPGEGLTKANLISYYRRIAAIMLPYVKQRPLTMQRFPDGIASDGFYQKEAPDYFPDWIERVPVPVAAHQDTQPQILCNYAATLVYLVNQGCITPHVWLSQADKLEYPDRLIFDLDPPDDDFDLVRAAARALRVRLSALGLTPYVMTTGSRGLHVAAPLDRSAHFDAVRAFARQIVAQLAAQHPDKFTIETRKEQRDGRLLLDYLRNAYAQTAVAPYAVRALPGAPIATPLDWDELDRPELHAQRYTVANIFLRLGQKKDPWRAIDENGRSLPP